MIATRPSTVSGPPRSPSSSAPTNGNVMLRTTTPALTRISAASTWPASLAAGRQVARVVPRADERDQRGGDQDPARALAVGHEQQRGDQRAREDREPAEQRRRLARRGRAAFSSSTAPTRRAKRATTGVRSAAAAKATRAAYRASRSIRQRRIAGRRLAGVRGRATNRDCTSGVAGKARRHRPSMMASPAPHPPPAGRRLPGARRRSRAAGVPALGCRAPSARSAAAVTLALAAPLAWAAAAPGRLPADQPAATQAGKAFADALVADDDDRGE